jgi:hypothetical protein
MRTLDLLIWTREDLQSRSRQRPLSLGQPHSLPPARPPLFSQALRARGTRAARAHARDAVRAPRAPAQRQLSGSRCAAARDRPTRTRVSFATTQRACVIHVPTDAPLVRARARKERSTTADDRRVLPPRERRMACAVLTAVGNLRRLGNARQTRTRLQTGTDRAVRENTSAARLSLVRRARVLPPVPKVSLSPPRVSLSDSRKESVGFKNQRIHTLIFNNSRRLSRRYTLQRNT